MGKGTPYMAFPVFDQLRGHTGKKRLLTGPRGRTAANIAASGPSDRAAGRFLPDMC
jgi:hypothetical protein